MIHENLGIPDLSREESPEIFFRLFSQVTGMQKGEGFKPKPDPTNLAEEATVIGAVIIGSSVREGSKPKDLDVLLVVKDSKMPIYYGLCSPELNRYRARIQHDFDRSYNLERGIFTKSTWGQSRLDIIQLFHYECEPVCAFATGALRRNKNVLVFAFLPKVAKLIAQKVTRVLDASIIPSLV